MAQEVEQEISRLEQAVPAGMTPMSRLSAIDDLLGEMALILGDDLASGAR